MVKKANDKWRMCTDYTDLNKTCPKDPYPLPNIDRLVMSFGRKNAGSTYLCLMDKIFKNVIGTNVEVYVDDMVMKSTTADEHYSALERVFGILRRHQLKLNLKKCSFNIQAGRFLGFMLTERGIEANSEKCQAHNSPDRPPNPTSVVKVGPSPKGGGLERSTVRFKVNNNQAEYEALLVGMRLAKELEAKILTAKRNSKLVTSQVNGEYQARDPQLIKYWERATKMMATFEKFTLLHVPRDQNERVNLLSKLARGACGTYISSRALASKITRAGYYWPNLKHDCMEYVKKYDKCQRFAKVHKAPLEQLHSVTSPWPFYKWVVDILGPFLMASGQIKYLIVAVNYFTKWVEVELVVTFSTERIKHFYWKKIICRFGLPTEIISDNGTWSASWLTVEFCAQLKIKQLFTSVEHP
ncbi:putative protein K02A2.6, partial [Mucuna pruriens]